MHGAQLDGMPRKPKAEASCDPPGTDPVRMAVEPTDEADEDNLLLDFDPPPVPTKDLSDNASEHQQPVGSPIMSSSDPVPSNLDRVSPARNSVSVAEGPQAVHAECWAGCGMSFHTTASLLFHFESRACKATPEITPEHIHNAAAMSEVCQDVIDGRYLRDLTMGSDVTAKYRGNAYPFVCPSQDCGIVFQKLHSLFRHMEAKKCQHSSEASLEVLRELREALKYRTTNGYI